MRLLVIALLVVGVVMVVNGYMAQNMQCPPERIVYKYIPRTFTEEQENPVKVSDVFGKLFKDADPLNYGM